jgi:hypothetical protein
LDKLGNENENMQKEFANERWGRETGNGQAPRGRIVAIPSPIDNKVCKNVNLPLMGNGVALSLHCNKCFEVWKLSPVNNMPRRLTRG